MDSLYLTMYSKNNNTQIQLLLACLYFSSHIFYDNTTVPKTLNYQIIRITVRAYSSCIEVYLWDFLHCMHVFFNVSEPEKHTSQILYKR